MRGRMSSRENEDAYFFLLHQGESKVQRLYLPSTRPLCGCVFSEGRALAQALVWSVGPFCGVSCERLSCSFRCKYVIKTLCERHLVIKPNYTRLLTGACTV